MVSDDELEDNWLITLWKYDKGIIFLCLLTITAHFYLGGLEVDRWVDETKGVCIGLEKYKNLTNIDLDYLNISNTIDGWINDSNS